MLPATHQSEEPHIVDAALRVFEAGQRVVLDRVDLARLDLAQIAARTLRGAALIAVGAVVLAGAWFAFMAGLVVWLQAYMTLTASLALVGGVSVAAGAAMIALGVQRANVVEAATEAVAEEARI